MTEVLGSGQKIHGKVDEEADDERATTENGLTGCAAAPGAYCLQ